MYNGAGCFLSYTFHLVAKPRYNDSISRFPLLGTLSKFTLVVVAQSWSKFCITELVLLQHMSV